MTVLRDTVDVREFGPSGLGSTIQAAEDWASSVLGGTIRIPQGDWVVTTGLVKSPRTVWLGTGNRYVASATESRKVASSRLVGQVNGPIVTVVGLGANTIKQRGRIEGVQVANSSEATYPNAVCVEVTNDVQEHVFRNLLCNGGAFGFKASSPLATGAALYFINCYQTGATDTGVKVEDYTDCWFINSQFDGTVCGGNLIRAHAFNSLGTRWQVSETNLRIQDTSFAMVTGGFCDTGTGIGIHLINGEAARIQGTTFYSNGGDAGDAHLVLESTTGATQTGIWIDATFHKGSNPTHQTPIGIKGIVGGTTTGISIGGDLRNTPTPLSGSFGSNWHVRPGTLGIPSAGTTAERPSLTSTGFTYFDSTLGKPIWWDGTAWKDAGGITA